MRDTLNELIDFKKPKKPVIDNLKTDDNQIPKIDVFSPQSS